MIIATSRRRRGWTINRHRMPASRVSSTISTAMRGCSIQQQLRLHSRPQRSPGHDSIRGQTRVNKNPGELGLPNFRIHLQEHDKFSDDVDSCVSFGFPCDSRTRDFFRPQIALAGISNQLPRLEDWSTSTFGVQYNRRSASTNGGIDESHRQCRLLPATTISVSRSQLAHNPGNPIGR
mgnify:CR=1 FL=1